MENKFKKINATSGTIFEGDILCYIGLFIAFDEYLFNSTVFRFMSRNLLNISPVSVADASIFLLTFVLCFLQRALGRRGLNLRKGNTALLPWIGHDSVLRLLLEKNPIHVVKIRRVIGGREGE